MADSAMDPGLLAAKPDRAANAQGAASDIGLYGAPPAAFALVSAKTDGPLRTFEAGATEASSSASIPVHNIVGLDLLVASISSFEPVGYAPTSFISSGAVWTLPLAAATAPDAYGASASFARDTTQAAAEAFTGSSQFAIIQEHAAGLKQAIANLKATTGTDHVLAENIAPMIEVQQQAADVIGTMSQWLESAVERPSPAIDAAQILPKAMQSSIALLPSPLPGLRAEVGEAISDVQATLAPQVDALDAATFDIATPLAATTTTLTSGIEATIGGLGNAIAPSAIDLPDIVQEIGETGQFALENTIAQASETLQDVIETGGDALTAAIDTALAAADDVAAQAVTAANEAIGGILFSAGELAASAPILPTLDDTIPNTFDRLGAAIDDLAALPDIAVAAGIAPSSTGTASTIEPLLTGVSGAAENVLSILGQNTPAEPAEPIFAGNDPAAGIQTLTSLVSVADVFQVHDEVSADLGLADALGATGTLDLLAPPSLADSLLGHHDIDHHDFTGLHGFDLGLG